MNSTMKKEGSSIRASFFLFFRHVGGVLAPFGQEGLHVRGQGGIKAHGLAGAGMVETERPGMEGLAGT